MIFKKWIFTSLSPNTERDDIWRALGLIFQPWAWRDGRARGVLEEEIKSYFGGGHVFLFSTGRGALSFLLVSYGFKEGDEVIIQGYTCVAVPDAVLWAGLRPIYADIDPETFNISAEDIERKITSRTRVIVVQHTFGIPADMEKIMKISRARNLIVIEDLAHSLGSKYDSKVLGTVGDAAFLSFGRDKALSSVFGGAIVVRNEKNAAALRQIYAGVSEAGRLWTLKQLLHPIFLSIAKSLYGVMGLGRLFLGFLRIFGFISKAVRREEKEGGAPPGFVMRRMPNALARLADEQFEKLSRFTSHRKKISDFYQEALGGSHFKLPGPYPNSSPSYLRFPLRSMDASRLIIEARKNSIELGDWYNVPVAPCGVNYEKVFYEAGSCPESEKAALESLNLPTHIGIEVHDARAIISFLRKHHVGD